MVEGDIFREVEEDLRRDRIKAIWDRIGGFVLLGAFAIIAIVAGFKGYEYWSRERARTAGLEYASAAQLLEDGKTEEGVAELQAIASGGTSGYGALAQLRLAALKSEAGEAAEALKLFDQASKSAKGDDILRTMARLRAGMLALEAGDYAGVKSRLASLAVDGNPWRHTAREVIGMADYRTGDRAAAEATFQKLLGDLEAPSGIRQRAQAMLELIVRLDAKSPESGANAGAGDSGPTAADPASPTTEAVTATPEPAAETPEPTTTESGTEPSTAVVAPEPTTAETTAGTPAAAAPEPAASAETTTETPVAPAPATGGGDAEAQGN